MFADAYEVANRFTRPILSALLDHRGECDTGLGACVALNDEGWLLTALHVVKGAQQLGQSRQAWLERSQEIDRIKADPALKARQRKARLRGVEPKRTERFVKEFALHLAFEGSQIKEGVALEEADLAAIRVEPFDPSWVEEYPRIKDPSQNMKPGTSLCTLGYPFYELKPEFDSATGFNLPVMPNQLYPIEGIFTRQILTPKQEETFRVGFVECSNPGLKGQSGGPVVDQQGTIWGIQVRTHHLELGFSVKPKNTTAKAAEEHQFLNAGLSVHPETLVGVLEKHGIAFAKSEY